MTSRSFLATLATSVALSLPTFADVLTVGGTAPTHGNIQQAIYAASNGDVILVRSAPTGDVLLSGKGLAIVADAPGQLVWTGNLRIEHIPAGRVVLVAGFTFGLTSTTPLVLAQSAGAIRIQDCGIVPVGAPPTSIRYGLECTDCDDVALIGCGVNAPPPPSTPFDGPGGYTALRAKGSRLAIQDSVIRGGRGRDGYYPMGPPYGIAGAPGGPGFVLDACSLVLQSSVVWGGAGGKGLDGSCASQIWPTAGGAGGTGIVLNGDALARAIGGRTLGGSGGIGGVSVPCAQAKNGAPGVPVAVVSGRWARVPGPDRSFLAPRIVRVGEPLAMSVYGAPFEPAYLARSSTAAHVDSLALEGVFLLGHPLQRALIGSLDAQGALTYAPPTPPLPAGATNDLMHLQSILADPSGRLHLGCARVVVRVAAGL